MGWVPISGSGGLDGLSDVNAPSPDDGDVLTWDDGAGEWVADAPTGGGGSSSDVVSAVEAVDDAAVKTVYPNGGSAVYDPVSNRTFIAYLGLDRDLFVTYYDHQAGTFATPVGADTRQIAVTDNHPAPSICVDLDGHVHIAWGSHSSSHRHVKSDNPWDISAWTAQSLSGDGTYPEIRCDPASGSLYIIDRAGTVFSHTSPFPSHAYGSLYKSTNGGTSWVRSEIIDTSSLAAATDFYPLLGSRFDNDGYLHIVWTVAEQSSGHDGSRNDIYHAKLDPSDDTFYTADGTSLGATISGAELDSCRVATVTDMVAGNFALHGDYIAITYMGPMTGDREHHAVVWDGSTWTDTATGIDGWDTVGLGMPYYAAGALRGLFCVDDGGSHSNVDLYGGLPDGTDWSKIATVLEGASGEGYVRVSPVIGGGPLVALAMEAPTGNADTSATVSDLLPIQAIFDPAAAEHSHGAAEAGSHNHDADYADISHTHDSRYYTEAEVDALLATVEGQRYEVVLTGSGVNLEPVTNEDEDDWLYGAVS